jgi:glycerol-3-phosphate dehydrogenase (NAD(P)+)
LRLAVIGAGSFGTAMATVAARNDNDVLLWAHDPRVADAISSTRSNPFYLPDVTLPDRVHATSSLDEAAAFSDTFFMIVPSQYYRGVLAELRNRTDGLLTVISGTKGIENETLERMSGVTRAVLGERLSCYGALSGPTFAAEASKGDPTAAVVASGDLECAQRIQHILSSATFRLYHSDDVVGVEIAGALKNVIAIAAGVLEGLGLGYNTTAALITRGLHEITRLGIALGGKPDTFAGLAGMGDLVLTCTGSLSRNRMLGVALGKGKTLSQFLAETRAVAEGVKTSKAARDLAEQHGIEMPITTEMYRVLYENESPTHALQRLMTRSLKAESSR